MSSTQLPSAITKRGSQAAQQPSQGDTALHGAAAKGNPGACRLLIQADADIDMGSNSDGFTDTGGCRPPPAGLSAKVAFSVSLRVEYRG